jgi:glycerol uptake facilitator-like aquaporin
MSAQNEEQTHLVDNPQKVESVQEQPEWYMKLLGFFPMAIYEFVGIFFFVICICFTMGNVNHFIFGFWVVLVFFGNYSGAHVNPAITLGFYIYDGDWGFGLIKLILYWIAQVLGSACASKMSYFLLHKSIFVAVPKHSNTFEVFWAECMFTGTFLFVILYVCSKTTTPPNTNGPIKCAVIVGWFYCAAQMGSTLSGSAFNPAILFTLNGWDYLAGDKNALSFVGYMIGAEFLGAIVFALFFKYIFEKTYPNQNEQK